MKFELFVALRYLFSRQKQTFISVISLISILGVFLGVASLIVVLGVMNGLSTDLRDKILGVNAHVMVMSLQGGFAEFTETAEKLREFDSVEGVSPFIYTEVMLSTQNGVKGAVLRGVEPDSAAEVLSLKRDMIKGKLSDLKKESIHPGIILGSDLADRLNVDIGRRVNLLSPSGKTTAGGFTPKISIFEVVGIFKTGLFEYDSSMAYISLDAAADIMGYKDGIKATGFEIKVDDVFAADKTASTIEKTMGYPVFTRHWMEMNANLFAALKLEKTAMFIILVLIVLVGSFSIITTLVMLVMEKTQDIAILMSMGARPKNIARIFIMQGTVIGAVGTVLGYIVGLTLCLLLREYQFIKLPEGVYSLDHLTVRLEWLDLTLIGVSAMLLCFLATLYPARQASKLKPAEALRYE